MPARLAPVAISGDDKPVGGLELFEGVALEGRVGAQQGAQRAGKAGKEHREKQHRQQAIQPRELLPIGRIHQVTQAPSRRPAGKPMVICTVSQGIRSPARL